MNIEQKIMKNLVYEEDAVLDEIRIASEKNKAGETLYYIKASVLELQTGPCEWYNGVTYYAFDEDGNNVSNVLVKVSHSKKVELEYEAIKEYQNRGNATVIAKEAIKDVFENNILDGLKTRVGIPETCIELMEVQISPYNTPSKKVAKKLGFDESGYLDKEDYYRLKEEQSISIEGLKK